MGPTPPLPADPTKNAQGRCTGLQANAEMENINALHEDVWMPLKKLNGKLGYKPNIG